MNRFLTDAERFNDKRNNLNDILEFFVFVSKENNQCKVIFTSSDYSFPLKLDEYGSGNFLSSITDKIYAGELSPQVMVCFHFF